MLIRFAISRDSEAWLQMRQALWPDAGVVDHRRDIERYFAGDRREPAEVLLALTADLDPLGFAELSIRNIVDGCSTDRVAYLEGWYVAPASRRKGIGRAILQAAEQWAVRQGCTEFGSDSEIDNEVSLACHLQLGFEETGRVRTYRKKLGQ